MKGFSPDFNFSIFVHPLGLVQVTLKTGNWGYVRDSGHEATDKGQGWGYHPLKFADKWWDNGWNEFDKAQERKRNSYNDWKGTKLGDLTRGAVRPIEAFGSIRLTVNL
ncbi:MAG: hypothetical protein IJ781_03275 [Atopobiaceae bacterium]|nr:hypothetical protein [Atopobiaceae bacterium]